MLNKKHFREISNVKHQLTPKINRVSLTAAQCQDVLTMFNQEKKSTDRLRNHELYELLFYSSQFEIHHKLLEIIPWLVSTLTPSM